MKGSSAFVAVLTIGMLYMIDPLNGGRFDWMTYDNFDTINDQLIALQKTNCRTNPSARLPYETLAQLPRFNQLLQVIIYQNRTKLLHVHNMALTRAYYFAFIFQVLNKSVTDFAMQPGMEYYYYSQAADLVANPYSINGSAVFMDNNCTYANWLQNLLFNDTLPLFGPRAWRLDDYNQPYNWLREPTNKTIFIEDYGAGANYNYTAPTYGNNPWYTDMSAGISYLPDLSASQTTVQKYQFYVGIKWAAGPGQFLTNQYQIYPFFGPPLPGQKDSYLPVMFTSPYFDCARTNHWIISAVAPIVDFMPRYSIWFQVRRPRYTGVVAMDTDFLQIDINQCPTSPGNQPLNFFANTARCKSTTQCMPLMGWGFRRGGYQCMCLPGYRYPFWQNGPFQGLDIEQATAQEYANGFDCVSVGWLEVWQYTAGIAGGSSANSVTGKRRKRDVSGVNDTEAAQIDDLVDGLLGGNSSSSQSSRSNWLSNTVGTALRYAGGFVKALFGGSHTPKKTLPVSDEVIKNYVQEAHASGPGLNTLDFDMVKNMINASIYPDVPVSSVLPEDYQLRNMTTDEVKPIKNKRKYVVKGKSETKEKPKEKKEDDEKDKEHKRYKRGLPYNGAITDIDSTAYRRMQDIFAKMASITPTNCGKYTSAQLQLPGDVAYGVETMFDNQARTALRLASFMSAFMQNADPNKVFGNFHGDQPLNVYQVFGEAIANVMGDLYMMASGVFFDQNAFVHPNGTVASYFGPWAFRPTAAQAASVTGSAAVGDQTQTFVTATNTYLAVDYTGFPNLYVNEPWFSTVKQRWGSNTYGLQKLLLLPYVRTDVSGSQLKNFEQFPIYYRSPAIDDGFWTNPYFECNMLNSWVVTFSAPFFGWNELKTAIQFKGVVTTTVNLNLLDINQCPAPFFVPNAFASTARCDLQSTYCQHIPGRGFTWGGYKCECRQGYEYPFNDGRTWYFDGMTMESQYNLFVANSSQSYFQLLKCREAGAAQLSFSIFAIVTAIILSMISRVNAQY